MTSPDRAGDFLLTFDHTPGSLCVPHRSPASPAAQHITEQNWTLALSEVGAGWVGMPYQMAAAGQLRAWLFGELYTGSLSALLQTLLADLSAALPLNGHALLLVLDTNTSQWHIWTDRFATLHAYHAPGALGTFFPAVAASQAQNTLDWSGLAGFFMWGFYPAERTSYANIRFLPPASHTVLDAQGSIINQSRYWNWQYAPALQRSFNDTVAQFADVFHQVIRSAIAGRRIALPISGGLDSRSAIAALPAQPDAHALWAYSYGYAQNSPEIGIARQVAAARSLPFTAFIVPPYLFDQIHAVTAAVEGFQDITQCRQAAFADEIGAHAEHVLAAHWGDVWLDCAGADVHTPTADLALKKFSKPGSAWLIENLILPHAPQAPNAAVDLIHAYTNAYAQIPDPDFRLKAVKTDLWSSRWTTASLRAYQRGAFPVLPFYDTRLADFFSTVPAGFLAGRALQIAYLKRCAPALARITWQAYDANLYQYQHFHTLQIPKRAVKKLWRAITAQNIPQRNWEVQFLAPGGRTGLEQWLLSADLRLHQFVEPIKLRRLLEDFFAQPHDREKGYALSMLVTFSAWLETYGR